MIIQCANCPSLLADNDESTSVSKRPINLWRSQLRFLLRKNNSRFFKEPFSKYNPDAIPKALCREAWGVTVFKANTNSMTLVLFHAVRCGSQVVVLLLVSFPTKFKALNLQMTFLKNDGVEKKFFFSGGGGCDRTVVQALAMKKRTNFSRKIGLAICRLAKFLLRRSGARFECTITRFWDWLFSWVYAEVLWFYWNGSWFKCSFYGALERNFIFEKFSL